MSHVCYVCRMADVASRDLRNNTRALLERVEAGESVTITVDGRAVATLEPPRRRPRFVSRDVFIHEVLSHRADAGLVTDLRALAPDDTDQLPLG
jgi:prevent-host-death family protein